MKSNPKSSPPTLVVADHQAAVSLDLPLLERILPGALSAVLALPEGPGGSLLAGLNEVELSILSDREISRQHQAFLGDPSPTDVITFQHGELLLSAETAARECLRFSHAVERELLLYAVHGFLHLHGYEDQSQPGHLRMHAMQDEILCRLWPE